MYFDPFDEISRMHEEMDRLFRMSYAPERKLIGPGKQLVPVNTRTPICHMQETETKMIATFELPGVDKKDINLTVQDNTIELQVESKNEKKHEDKENSTYSFMSQSCSFYRAISLPKDIDSSKAEAEYKDGMLRIEMPKKELGAKSKRLQIK